ncbi:MAG TPA: ParB/RepB/Spo0J family partition protein [Candidatus Nitrosopolaris sp.]|nr:ParB/RepB/Spo0J family partition protein [Candidatus Nitrosopolaris sp.]
MISLSYTHILHRRLRQNARMSYLGILQAINIGKIRHSPYQFRMDLDDLDDLASSIKEHGLLQPILVRPMQHEYEVVAGNRRLAASKLLKLRKISSHIIDLSDKEAYELGLVENVHHKTMNPIEEAIAFNQYVEGRGWGGITQLAARIGRSQEYVTKRIQLLRLPQNIRNEIIRQRISPSAALEMLPLDTSDMQEFADFVIKNPLSKVEIRNIVKASRARSNDLNDRNGKCPSKDMSHEKELYLIDKALRKSVAVMKSTLVNFDDIVNSVNDDWILKELFMQYRMIIHGDIDTFLKLRKRLRMKMPREYLNLPRDEKKPIGTESDPPRSRPDDKTIYQWATRGVWQ